MLVEIVLWGLHVVGVFLLLLMFGASVESAAIIAMLWGVLLTRKR